MIDPVDVIKAIETYGTPEIEALIDGLCGPCAPFVKAGLPALTKLAEAIALAISSRSELDDMRSAVQGADATVDATEAEVLGGKI